MHPVKAHILEGEGKPLRFSLTLINITTMELSIYSFDDGEIVSTMLVLSHSGRFFSNHSREEADEFIKLHERFNGLVSTVYPSGDFVTMAHMLHLDELEPYRSVYSVDRCYGGPEEGGWWYNHYTHMRILDDSEIFENDDQNELLIIELFAGSRKTTTKPHYC